MQPVEGLIVVLGSPNSEQGELHSVAVSRCRLALQEHRQRVGWKFLPTGGYGAHFNTTDRPHAAYLKHYLVEHGVAEQDFVEFAESTNTLEDASLSKPIVQKCGVDQIVVITSDYHLDRAQYIFEYEFVDTGIELEFSVCETDEELCEFDLVSQKEHEKKSLTRLKLRDNLK